MLILLLAACQDYRLGAGKDDPPGAGPDSDPTIDTQDSAQSVDSDTAAASGDCPDDWPDRAVAVRSDCSLPPADWSLKELWHLDEPQIEAVTAHAARFDDTDGDGAITRADTMSLWGCPYSLHSSTGGQIVVDGPTGALVREETGFAGSYRTYARTADFDPMHLGMEVGLPTDIFRDGTYWHGANAGSTSWGPKLSDSHATTQLGTPWFVDAGSDGTLDVIVGSLLLDPTTGAIERVLDPNLSNPSNVAADLDRDGLPEIIAASGRGAAIWPGTGGDPFICPTPSYDIILFGVGNLDDDEDGEVVAATSHLLTVCDTDGAVLASLVSETPGGSVVGIGEIDGDPEPEIVTDFNYYDGTDYQHGIVAYDTALNELWRWSSTEIGWNPFTLADLDGDGMQEIVVRELNALTILDGAGVEITSIEAGTSNNHWKNVPLVVDVDGDDLAEIVVSGSSPVIQVIENSSGGWLVDEGGVPAPGADQHPGIMNEAGEVPTVPEIFWADPRRNVWQGHPLGDGTAHLPDLAVTIDAVCAESCSADYQVTVYVSNIGPEPAIEPIHVSLVRVTDGVEVGSGTLPAPLDSGVARALDVSVPVASATGGLRAVVDPNGQILECDEADAAATWMDLPCP